MTNQILDQRIMQCAMMVGELVVDLQKDLQSTDITIEQAVCLGSLLTCSMTLHSLCYTAEDREES